MLTQNHSLNVDRMEENMRRLCALKNRIYIVLTIGFVLGLSGTAIAQTAPKSGDKFGDWVFLCRGIAEGQTSCSLNQTLVAQQTNSPIARFQITRNTPDDDTVALVAILPLGIAFRSGVVGKVDDGSEFPMPLQTCLKSGCISRTVLNAETLDALKSGQKLNVNFNFMRSKNRMTLPVSLTGLTAGFAAARF